MVTLPSEFESRHWFALSVTQASAFLPVSASLALAALVSAALGACAPALCEPPSCDVRESACRRAVMAATACLRGEEPREVRARVVRVEEFVEAEQTSVDDAEVAHFEAVAAGWALLGLQRELDYRDVLDAYYATVGAFYDPVEDAVTILHRGSPLDSDAMVATLVHEFSHALQHDAVDEDGRAVAILTTDVWLGRSAMFEGDATRTTDQALMRMFGADPKAPDWGKVYEKWSDMESALYAAEPLRITLAGRYFVYAFGATFAERVAAESGARYRSEVNTWMREPPLSARAVVAGPARARSIDDDLLEASADRGVGALAPEADVPPNTGDAGMSDAGATQDAGKTADAGSAELDWRGPDLLLPVLPEHRLLDADSIGSFVLDSYAAHVQRLLAEEESSDGDLRSATHALISDSLTVWRAEQRTVVIFRAQFTERRYAKRWSDVLERVNPGPAALRTRLDGDALIVVSSEDEAWLQAFALDRLQWLRVSPAQVAARLTLGASSNAASGPDDPLTWRSRLSRGCVSHPGAMFLTEPGGSALFGLGTRTGFSRIGNLPVNR